VAQQRDGIQFHKAKILFSDPHGSGFLEAIVPTDANGLPSPYVHYESPTSRRIAGLGMILNDLNFSKSVMTAYFQMPDETATLVFRSMWIGAIITYAKCFASSSEGRGLTLHSGREFRGHSTLQKYMMKLWI